MRSFAITRDATAFSTSEEIGVCCSQKSALTVKHTGRNSNLIVRNSIVGDELLDLRGTQHPADIADNLDVVCSRLLELKELGRLHEVLELERALGDLVRLAPLLEPRRVVLARVRSNLTARRTWI